MRTLSETAQADIIKLTGGKPWCEVIDITLPTDYEPSATELTFLSKDPDDLYHILISNSIMESRLAIAATGWATQGLTAGYKWYFGVPYQRDPIEDSSEKKGAVNSRIMIGDTGGTIKAIVDKCDGFIGLNVSIGFAMVNSESAFTASTGFIECYEPDVTYDWQIKTTTHDKKYFSCTLFIDSPIEWKFPPRTMFKNVCHFAFRGTECGFDGNVARLVKPKRGADIIGKSIYPGGWLISGGYVEKLDLTDGSITTESVASLTDDDYEYITTVNGNYFYGKRNGCDWAIYFDGSMASQLGSINALKIISDENFPLEKTMSSGSNGDFFAITNTLSTRYLCRFTGHSTSYTIGTPYRYYNIVSSPSEGVAFAIQGGTYSGGTFTPSDVATGRLVRINGTTQASISEDISWKWVGAVSATTAYAIDSDNYLYYFDGTDLLPVRAGISDHTQIFGVMTKEKFSCKGGYAFIISNYSEEYPGVIRILNGAHELTVDWSEQWLSVYAIDETSAFGTKQDGIFRIFDYLNQPSFGWFQAIYEKPTGFVSGMLSIIGTSVFYYVSGGNLYLYKSEPYSTCNHRLSDCLARGNQERFGGYPGIGSGGLTQ